MKRRGKLKAIVAVAHSIMVIVWHLLADPKARLHHLGADFYTTSVNTQRLTRDLVHQLEVPGHRVTSLSPPEPVDIRDSVRAGLRPAPQFGAPARSRSTSHFRIRGAPFD